KIVERNADRHSSLGPRTRDQGRTQDYGLRTDQEPSTRDQGLRVAAVPHISSERTIRAAHLVVRVVGVPSTRIREDKHRSVTKMLFLNSERDCSSAVWKQRAEDGDTDERDDLRTIPLDFAAQFRRSSDVLVAR